MNQLVENHERKPDISESFLRHVEETVELLENPYSKSLLKKAVKHIREQKRNTAYQADVNLLLTRAP